MKNRLLKTALMAVGYFALIVAVTFILSRVKNEPYQFNWLIYAIGSVLFALITEFFPASRWR
ncbi:MAG: hypothetical protein IKZ82_02480 [Clostridia bacterium]|nr:hypothetical protein [Clostridia bacterium]